MAYIGASPSNGVRKVHTYTATAGQTTFSGASNENITLSYSDGTYVDVYQNGILLGTADYTATSGTSIVLTQAASLNDIVVITVYDIFSVADTVSKSDGGTFDGNVTMGGTLGVTGATTLNSNMTVNNADIIVTGTGNRAINLTSSDAIASMELGGSTSAFIDFKMPSSDDFDMRVQSGATGGNISIASGNFNISGGATLLNATHSGAVTLYHNGNSKLATNTGGVTVTGTLGGDGLSIDGTIKLDGNYPVGTGNLALGESALNGSITGTYNTAIGDYAMQPLTSGERNTACGGSSLRYVTSGYHSTAVGNEALRDLTSGHTCTAVGYLSQRDLETGNLNASLGTSSMLVATTAQQNSAVGHRSLVALTTGTGNCGIGIESGSTLSTGSYNTLIGRYAGKNITTGNYNTCVGNDNSVSTGSAEFQQVIGHGQVGKGNSTSIILGACYQGNNSSTWSTVSDKRIKKNIVDNNTGLDAVKKVQVRNFEYRDLEEIVDFDNPKAAFVNKEGVQLGVIAQEIQAVLPDMVKEETTGVLSVSPDNMTWYLVNAVKELSAKNDELEARLAKLEGK